MTASKRWQPKNNGIVPRATHTYKILMHGYAVTFQKFESALEAARRQGLISDAPHATGFADSAANRYIQGGNSTVVYRGLV